MRKKLITLACAVVAAGALAFGGASLASAGTHPRGVVNATNTCGTKCNDLFNEALTFQYIQSAPLGTWDSVVLLARAHNYLKSEDFIATKVGTLGQFCRLYGGTGLFPDNSYACLNYPKTFPVFENEYSPYSVSSGLCIGVRKHRVTINAGIRLIDCGLSARSLWVGDINNAVPDPTSVFGFDVPWVNAASTFFSDPLVLSGDDNGRLSLQELSKNGGGVDDAQLWGVKLGPAA